LLRRIDTIFSANFRHKGNAYLGMIAYLKEKYQFTYIVLKYNERNHISSIRLRKFI